MGDGPRREPRKYYGGYLWEWYLIVVALSLTALSAWYGPAS